MKFAICNETYQDWAVEDQFRHASEIGYDGIEIAPFTLEESAFDISAERRAELRKMSADYGLEITGLHWLLVSPKGLYLTDPDEQVRQKTVEYLQELCRLCSDLGGKTLVFGSPAQRNVKDGVTFEQAWEFACDGYRRTSETASERDVYLLMEALPEPECNFIQTLDDAMRMCDDVDHPNFQMMVDVKSMSAEGKPLDDLIKGTAERLKYVHANDANLRGPGFGDTDFRVVLSALQDIGYDGYVSVEVFDYSPDPETIAIESLKHLKQIQSNLKGNN